MTTARQAEANRRNAKRSTGPRTLTGKAVVALNGVKHGLLSRVSLVKGEREADLVDFGKRLRSQLAPAGELELLLVDRIVSTSWRLRRLVSVETILFDRENDLGDVLNRPGRDKISVLSRYEVTLERSLYTQRRKQSLNGFSCRTTSILARFQPRTRRCLLLII